MRVRQCVSNLLSNAIKFTDAAAVSMFALSAAEQAGGAQQVTMCIADTGIGMDSETVGRAVLGIHPGGRLDVPAIRRLGLGLGDLPPACPGDGRRHRRGQRTGRRIQFPPDVHGTSRRPARPHGSGIQRGRRRIQLKRIWARIPRSAGARILLVDDNAVNRQVVKLFLKPFAPEIREAVNGLDALEALRRAPFDLVLLDVHMPVMDGCETIKAIRSGGEAWRDLPVIALTADAMGGDRERIVAMGMTDYMAKPIDQRELISKITAALALRSEPPADVTAISVTRYARRSNA